VDFYPAGFEKIYFWGKRMAEIRPDTKLSLDSISIAANRWQNHWLGTLLILLAVIFIHSMYLFAFYYLLTTDNSFNFNNNYHLIAFLTCLAVLINMTLFVFYVDRYHAAGWQSSQNREDLSQTILGLSEGEISYLGSSLLLVTLTVFPFVLYFMLMDEFVIRVRLLIPLLLGIGLFAYAYWGCWKKLVRKNGIISRLIYFVFFCILILLLLDVLTGIIPAPIHSGSDNVIFPL